MNPARNQQNRTFHLIKLYVVNTDNELLKPVFGEFSTKYLKVWHSQQGFNRFLRVATICNLGSGNFFDQNSKKKILHCEMFLMETSWQYRPNPEDQIQRKPDDQKNDQMTKKAVIFMLLPHPNCNKFYADLIIFCPVTTLY